MEILTPKNLTQLPRGEFTVLVAEDNLIWYVGETDNGIVVTIERDLYYDYGSERRHKEWSCWFKVQDKIICNFLKDNDSLFRNSSIIAGINLGRFWEIFIASHPNAKVLIRVIK